MRKNKNNIQKYYELLPLFGLLATLFLFILYFIIYKVDDNWMIVSLYCLLPLIVFSCQSLFFRLFKNYRK